MHAVRTVVEITLEMGPHVVISICMNGAVVDLMNNCMIQFTTHNLAAITVALMAVFAALLASVEYRLMLLIWRGSSCAAMMSSAIAGGDTCCSVLIVGCVAVPCDSA